MKYLFGELGTITITTIEVKDTDIFAKSISSDPMKCPDGSWGYEQGPSNYTDDGAYCPISAL